jgi:hypothetical protein
MPLFRDDLMRIAKTTLSSKLLTHEKDHFAKLAVDAVMRIKGGTLDLIQVGWYVRVYSFMLDSRSGGWSFVSIWFHSFREISWTNVDFLPIHTPLQVIKKSGASLKNSYLEEGFILEKRIGGCIHV